MGYSGAMAMAPAGLCALAACLLLAATGASAKPILRFNPDSGRFKIGIFTDQHYGENAWESWGPAQDRRSDEVSRAILRQEMPDLVVFNGDQLTANNLLSSNATAYWDMLTQPAAELRLPWAAVLGNHDDQPFEWTSFKGNPFGPEGIPGPFQPPTRTMWSAGAEAQRRRRAGGRMGAEVAGVTSRSEVIRYDESKELSLSEEGPPELWPAAGNFFVRVWSGDRSRVAMLLYFLDSGGGSWPETISFAQAEWLNSTARRLNPTDAIPELLFFHIPTAHFAALAPQPGAPISAPCFGSLNDEGVAAQEPRWQWGEEGVMGVIRGRLSLKAVFSGHNHGAEWCCPMARAAGPPLWLCEGRHSGYGGYATANDVKRGAKFLDVLEDPLTFQVWVRMEDGTVPTNSSLTF